MFISSSSIQKIKKTVDIVDLISAYVNLELRGNEYFGKCPFHEDDNPSFVVYPDTQSFYCFGCQAGKGEANDLFGFIQKKESLSFLNSVKFIADKYNINIVTINKKYKKHNSSINNLKNIVNLYHKELLNNKKALLYLKERNIFEEQINDWKLGFVPENINSSLRNRLVFPIYNNLGIPVGFSGRSIFNEEPKYKNSSNSSLFKKRELLYGLNKAEKIIKDQNCLIIVEGFIDVIAMHKVGIKNTIGTMGTALTQEHAKIIKNLIPSGNVYIVFDGDISGKKASLLADKELRKQNIRPLIFPTMNNMDPDNIVLNIGSDFYNLIIKNSKTIPQFQIEKALSSYYNKQSEIKLEIMKELNNVFDCFNIKDNNSWLELESYFNILSNALNVNKDELKQRLFQGE